MATAILDKDELLEEFGDEWEILATAFSIFKESYKSIVLGLDEAILEQNANSVHALSHELKGAVSNFCCPVLVEKLNELEQLGKMQKMSEIGQKFESIKSDTNMLIQEIENLLQSHS